MSSDNEKGPNSGLAQDDILEDTIPKLDWQRTLEVLQAAEDAHLGLLVSAGRTNDVDQQGAEVGHYRP